MNRKKFIGNTSWKPIDEGAIDVQLNQLAATGDYDLLVISDSPGPFTLELIDPNAEESVEAIEAKISKKKMELAELETQLKAAIKKRELKSK